MLAAALLVVGGAAHPEPAHAFIDPVPLVDPALEADLKAFITSDAARNAPTRVRGSLILGGEVAAGEIPALTRALPLCATGLAAVGCVAGAGYVGWKIGGAVNRWARNLRELSPAVRSHDPAELLGMALDIEPEQLRNPGTANYLEGRRTQ